MKSDDFKPKTLILVALFLAPLFSYAQIEITEIMYNLDGADSGREWIEVCNSGGTDVDLSEWKFFENGTNHGLTLKSGSEILSSGSSAVIVSNDVKFLADWPNFSGNLFDSSFSLSNTGETLVMKDGELNVIDSVAYSSEQGGDGDGNTLTKSSGVFSGATASPGVADCVQVQTEQEEEEETTTTTTSTYVVAPTQTIWVDIGEDEIAVVGEEIEFESYAVGSNGEEITANMYLWNFGDGVSTEGSNVFHAYSYPGKYIAVLDVALGQYGTSDRKEVTVVPADISVTDFVEGEDGYIEITNDTDHELNISGWYLESGEYYFQFPENSLISNFAPIKFSNSVTDLVSLEELELLFPNGDVANKPKIPDPVAVIEIVEEPESPKIERDFEEKGLQSVATAVSSIDDSDHGEVAKETSDGWDVSLIKWLVALLVLIAGASIGVIIIRQDDLDDISDAKKIAKTIKIVN